MLIETMNESLKTAVTRDQGSSDNPNLNLDQLLLRSILNGGARDMPRNAPDASTALCSSSLPSTTTCSVVSCPPGTSSNCA